MDSQDVVFREIKDVIEEHVLPRDKWPKTIELETKDDELHDIKEHK